MKIIPARLISLLIVFTLISFIFSLRTVDAASFNQSYIRTDRQKAQTATKGLVCAEPVSAGIEDSVAVSFPASYSVSSNPTNWTVETSGLPSDATGWPGIGTATGVSGQTVNFPSADLVPGTFYCFRWNKTEALTLGTTVGQQDNAGISTRTAGLVTIDSKTFPLSTAANDQLAVSASVEPFARAAEIKINGVPDTRSPLSQNQEVTITVSYRHDQAEAYPMEISSEWDQGLIEGTGTNRLDMMIYAIGSASSADDGTKPVIDLVNRRITWYLPSLAPSSKFHEVSYRLNVQGDIPTDKAISVKIKANGRFVNSLIPEKTLTYTIKRGIPPTPIPTGSPASTIPLRFISIRIDEIADTYFNLRFILNKPATYTLSYGERANVLTKTITGLTPQNAHTVRITDLLPGTQYYFRITAKGQDGKSVTSDLFTATTASEKSIIRLSRDDFTVFWRKYFLLSQSIDTVVIPKNKPITITARLGESTRFFRIKALFKNENVLGINNIDPLANIAETPLVEILPGISSGEIQTPSRKGIYTIYFGLTDLAGGLYEKSAPYKFYVTDPLKVIDSKTKKPVENATVKILKYEEGLKQFTLLSNSFAIQSQTNEKGELDVVLPTGIYTVEVKSPRYKSQVKKVELGISSINYPIFELEQDYSFKAQASYYKEEIVKFFSLATLTIQDFFSSPNNKDIFLIFSLLFLVFLVVLNLHLRKKTAMADRVLSFSIIDILEFITVLCGLLFIRFLGIGATGDLAVSTLIIFALGILYIRRAFFRKKNK